MQHLTSVTSAFFATLVALFGTSCIYTGDVDAYLGTIEASELGITSIEIESPNTRMAQSFTEQFSVVGVVDFGDSETDLTNQVTWTVSNSSLGSISNSGLLTSKTETGAVIVTAKYAEMTATKTITVSDADLVSLLVKGASNVDACTYQSQYTVDGNYGTGDIRNVSANVTWTSSNDSLAIVDSDGFLVSYGDGPVDVTADLQGTSNTRSVTLDDNLASIAITPNANPVDVYLTIEQQFTATGTYSGGEVIDITRTVAWSSSNTARADFSDDSGDSGLLKPTAVGDLNITAQCGATAALDSQVVMVNPVPTVTAIYIAGGTVVSAEFADGEIQLRAFAEFTNGVIEITSDSETFWYVDERISGASVKVENDNGDDGLVSFSGRGQNRIAVEYTDQLNVTRTDTIIVVVE